MLPNLQYLLPMVKLADVPALLFVRRIPAARPDA